MNKPVNTLTFIKRLRRSYNQSKPVLNIIMVKAVDDLYELNLAGKPILFKQATYDKLKQLVEGTTELFESKEFDGDEKASYCLIPMTNNALITLSAYITIETRNQIIDEILPTL